MRRTQTLIREQTHECFLELRPLRQMLFPDTNVPPKAFKSVRCIRGSSEVYRTWVSWAWLLKFPCPCSGLWAGPLGCVRAARLHVKANMQCPTKPSKIFFRPGLG
ncbi:hypothetical protein AMTR_s00012p00262420 [Amborella trichopoda]|uniref:Uncharacterized protein n=1 Tax=Amborella trichopoda TaxID=13333 RepID=W1PLM0_AMBTC|nr:hypothetical protein AMTR_s00012p00262420 [Amborella trichopoda]